MEERQVMIKREQEQTERKELRSFLVRCVAENSRNVDELEAFFRSFKFSRKVDFTIYRKHEYFAHETRRRYFDGIFERLLSSSVILVDPDVGLEVKSMKGREENYITYAEVELLFNRMDRDSVLVVFQFIPRVERKSYLSQIGGKLKEAVNSSPLVYVSDNQVAFFMLTKDVETQRQVMNTIGGYGKGYNLIAGEL